eukprot:6185324-Pleurochrysis_carterae.AAC.1
MSGSRSPRRTLCRFGTKFTASVSWSLSYAKVIPAWYEASHPQVGCRAAGMRPSRAVPPLVWLAVELSANISGDFPRTQVHVLNALVEEGVLGRRASSELHLALMCEAGLQWHVSGDQPAPHRLFQQPLDADLQRLTERVRRLYGRAASGTRHPPQRRALLNTLPNRRADAASLVGHRLGVPSYRSSTFFQQSCSLRAAEQQALSSGTAVFVKSALPPRSVT